MSAFVVSQHHINFLVQIAVHIGSGRRLSWYTNNVHHKLGFDRKDFEAIGQKLLDENTRSVDYRYRASGIADAIGEPFTYTYGVPDCVMRGGWHAQTLKAIACLRYQSCEHPGWEASEACAFLRALEHATIDRLPGYESAVWEITKPMVTNNIVSLTDLADAQRGAR